MHTKFLNRSAQAALLAGATLSLFCLTACGEATDEAQAPSPKGALTAPPPRSGSLVGAANAASATAATAGVNCRRFGPPEDGQLDIVGVRLGMPAQEAFDRIACSNPAFQIRFQEVGGYEVPDVPGEPNPRKLISADAGLEKITVTLVGRRDSEVVTAVHREVEFAQGQEPPVDSLQQSLEAKYGTGYPDQDQWGRSIRYATFIIYSPDGQQLGSDNSDYETCRRYGSLVTDPVPNVNSRCGLTIGFMIKTKGDNPGLAEKLWVTLTDQRMTMDVLQAQIDEATAALAQRQEEELQRAADDVERAGQNSDRLPDL